MKNESIYISLPITGHNEVVQRKKALHIKNMLLHMGYETVVNPFDIYDAWRITYNREPTYEEIMQADLADLRTRDAIYMCRGWVHSDGCRRERNQAVNQGQTIIYEEE